MPSIAKTIGLILVVINPACLTAQTARSYGGPPGPSARPSTGFSLSPGPNGGFGAGQAPFQRAREIVPAAYDASPSSGDRPPAAGQPAQPSGEKSAGVALSPHGRQSSLPLPPPGRSNRTKPGPGGGLSSVVTVAGSLALVLGIFFLVAWGMRRTSPAAGTALPSEVFEVLGRAPMAGRQQVHLLRCGNKLILVSVTAAGAETLTEITDPAEVDRLAGLCRQAHSNSATAAFRQVFGQFASGHRRTGLFAASDREDLRPGHRREALVGAGVPATSGGLEVRDV